MIAHLEGGNGGGAPAPDFHAALRDAIEPEAESDHAGAYYSRHPVVSLIQSAVHEGRVEGKVPQPDEPFGPDDIRWITEIAKSLWERLQKGRHSFCDEPARGELPDKVRLVLVSDWGTGREAARTVAKAMRHSIETAKTPVHVIHLGDTYYSGTRIEGREHILADWPVKPGEGDRFASWCLNGNHDMYSGGYGYFETILDDPRFHRQRAADGLATSWFALQSKGWNVIGLDTAWNDKLPFEWQLGHLFGEQANEVLEAAEDHDRRLLLLSHHQLFVTGSDSEVGERIATALASTRGKREIDAWFWGHEHDCLAYEPHAGVKAAFAIGHGAVPQEVSDHDDPEWVRWRFTGSVPGDDGTRWSKHGFAVLDIDGDTATVHHLDEHGEPHHDPEVI